MKMQYKGGKYRRNRNIVRMPLFDEQNRRMPYVEVGKEQYAVFGRVTKLGANKKGAFKTNCTWSGGDKDGQPVYAVPIPLKGYSQTNLAYGLDGYMYLMMDGACYQSMKKYRTAQEQ